MLQMLLTTAPIFILMGLGYSAVRTQLVSDEALRAWLNWSCTLHSPL